MVWLVAICVLMVVSSAQAASLNWQPERDIEYALKVGNVTAEGRSVVQVAFRSNGKPFGMRWPESGESAKGTFLVTDPMSAPVVSIRLTVRPLPGTITVSNMSDRTKIPRRYLPVGGAITFCLLFPGCDTYLQIPMTRYGTRGVGLGGIITVNTFDDAGVKLSVTGNPWALGVASTDNGAKATGGGSPFNGETPISFKDGGIRRIVSTLGIEADSTGGPVQSRQFRIWYTMRFLPKPVPEPGVNLLLLAGVAGLCVLGRGRMRRHE